MNPRQRSETESAVVKLDGLVRSGVDESSSEVGNEGGWLLKFVKFDVRSR